MRGTAHPVRPPGSPASRKTGRLSTGEPLPPRRPALDMSDLDGLDAAGLKAIAERDALRALIAQTRRPTRHATAIVSAARNLLDFSSSKPEIKTDNKHSGTLHVEVSRVSRQ